MENILGERVKMLLHGDPITKAAKEIGLSQSVLSDIIAGKKKAGISSTTLIQLCSYFQVSADYLLGLADNATIEPEVQAVCQYTGLSQEAVEVLHRYQAGQDGGVYDVVYDPEEAQQTGRAYLQTISGILSHPDSRDIWKNAARASEIARHERNTRQEALDDVLNLYELDEVSETISKKLNSYLLTKNHAIAFHRQEAANILKRLLEDLEGSN